MRLWPRSAEPPSELRRPERSLLDHWLDPSGQLSDALATDSTTEKDSDADSHSMSWL